MLTKKAKIFLVAIFVSIRRYNATIGAGFIKCRHVMSHVAKVLLSIENIQRREEWFFGEDLEKA